MFLTNSSFKSKFHDVMGDRDYSYWNSVELLLRQAWFLVELRDTESDSDSNTVGFSRTLLLTNIDDVEHLLNSQNADSLVVLAVHVVLPKNLDGSGSWRMQQLESVWAAREPKKRGRKVEVFQFHGGLRFASSRTDTAVEDLVDSVLRFQVSQPQPSQ